jgi:hypothetical protein
MNNSAIPTTTTKGSTPPPSSTKPSPPPPTTTTSKITTDIKPAAAARKDSLSDLEKELQEFDIDGDKDDVSDAENGQSKGDFKKSAIEDEVKT